MTDRSWLEGLQELLLAFPDRDLSKEQSDERARFYRRQLDALTDEQWTHAVAEVIRTKTDTFFPAVGQLLELAQTWSPGTQGLPAPKRTEAELAEARAIAKWGLNLCRAAFEVATRTQPGPKEG